MNIELVHTNNPILRQTCLPISPAELRTRECQDLIELMLDEVYGKNNKDQNRNTNQPTVVGLSANQMGVNKRISIVDLAISLKGYSNIQVLVNPEITWKSKTIIERLEGCVSIPSVWGYVKRSGRVKVNALDRAGNKLQLDVKGWTAVLLQHELEHLNGILFIDHLEDPTKAHLVQPDEYRVHKLAKKNWNKFVDISKLVKLQNK